MARKEKVNPIVAYYVMIKGVGKLHIFWVPYDKKGKDGVERGNWYAAPLVWSRQLGREEGNGLKDKMKHVKWGIFKSPKTNLAKNYMWKESNIEKALNARMDPKQRQILTKSATVRSVTDNRSILVKLTKVVKALKENKHCVADWCKHLDMNSSQVNKMCKTLTKLMGTTDKKPNDDLAIRVYPKEDEEEEEEEEEEISFSDDEEEESSSDDDAPVRRGKGIAKPPHMLPPRQGKSIKRPHLQDEEEEEEEDDMATKLEDQRIEYQDQLANNKKLAAEYDTLRDACKQMHDSVSEIFQKDLKPFFLQVYNINPPEAGQPMTDALLTENINRVSRNIEDGQSHLTTMQFTVQSYDEESYNMSVPYPTVVTDSEQAVMQYLSPDLQHNQPLADPFAGMDEEEEEEEPETDLKRKRDLDEEEPEEEEPAEDEPLQKRLCAAAAEEEDDDEEMTLEEWAAYQKLML